MVPVWHHADSECEGIRDIETATKKSCVDPIARYPPKYQFDSLTNIRILGWDNINIY